MTLPRTSPSIAALALAFGMFLVLPGCGTSKPVADNKDKTDDKDKKDNPAPTPNPTPTPDPAPKYNPRLDPMIPKPPDPLDFTTGAGKDAWDFLQSVRDGTAKSDRLSVGFAKMIGLPVVFDGDRAKGYSASEAEGWLNRLGMSTGSFGVPFPTTPLGDVVLIRGAVGKHGGYALRIVRDGGIWKVDWLSASSVEVKGTVAAPTADTDARLRLFAATAVFETICDKDAMPQNTQNKVHDRVRVIAAGLTPELRKAWAVPFDGDKAEGYDYNATQLAGKVAEIGKNAESVHFSLLGDAVVAEVTRSGGMKAAYMVKLAKSATGQWLVEFITPQ